MNICFETFGCRLNRAEALEDEARCLAHGHKIVTQHALADIIVVRGCSVTSHAQRDCEHLIHHLRRHYPGKRLVVVGCLPGAEKRFAIPDHNDASPDVPAFEKLSRARCYLKVQDGCAGACTFCIVPKFRGGSVSKDFDAVLDCAKRYLDAGYHELVVTGCNLALYASGGRRLPELVAALAELDAASRVRLGSVEPCSVAMPLVDVMAAHANVCRSLHIPVQSGCDRILQAMRRPYCVADVEKLVAYAREQLPDIALGCDIMAGFPGEGEGDFLKTRRLVSALGFVNLHVFPYSERPGTPAATMPMAVDKRVRKGRANLLSPVAVSARQRFAERFVGRTVEVLVESHGVQPKGWTSEYLWFEGPLKPAPGDARTFARRTLASFVVRSTRNGVLHGVSV